MHRAPRLSLIAHSRRDLRWLRVMCRLEQLRAHAPGDVEVVINPEELEGLSEAEMEELYNQRLAEARGASGREDFSGMVAAKAQQQKRKAAAVRDAKTAKKSKDDFKF